MTNTVEQKWLDLDGTRIAFYGGGAPDGPPVVLLHGGGTDHAMLSWAEALPPLVEAGYHTFAPDYPGYGASPVGARPATIENLIAYVEAMSDRWSIRQAALVGISMGGAIALGYTLRRPDCVSRLVLIGSYGIQDRAPYHPLSYLLVRMPFLNRMTWAWTRKSKWAARYALGQIVRNPQSRTEALFESVYEAMQNPTSQEAFMQLQRDDIQWKGLKTNFTDRLPEIRVPVLLVHGTHDVGVPVRAARRAAERLPNARLVLFEGAGHWTQRDQPERFNRLLLDFLDEARDTIVA